MEPVAAKVFEFSKNRENDEQSLPEIPEKEIGGKTYVALSEDFKEAITILGLDQPAFSFSEDYVWMIETTKQILQKDGIEYFRGNVLNLMKAWDDFSKI